MHKLEDILKDIEKGKKKNKFKDLKVIDVQAVREASETQIKNDSIYEDSLFDLIYCSISNAYYLGFERGYKRAVNRRKKRKI